MSQTWTQRGLRLDKRQRISLHSGSDAKTFSKPRKPSSQRFNGSSVISLFSSHPFIQQVFWEKEIFIGLQVLKVSDSHVASVFVHQPAVIWSCHRLHSPPQKYSIFIHYFMSSQFINWWNLAADCFLCSCFSIRICSFFLSSTCSSSHAHHVVALILSLTCGSTLMSLANMLSLSFSISTQHANACSARACWGPGWWHSGEDMNSGPLGNVPVHWRKTGPELLPAAGLSLSQPSGVGFTSAKSGSGGGSSAEFLGNLTV